MWIEPLEIQRWRQRLEAMNANAAQAEMARTSLTIQENELRDGRGPRSAMRCYEILYVEELKRRAMPSDLMRGRDQVSRRIGERRSMQNLTDVTSRFGALRVMVQKRDARHDVEKHYAAKHGDGLARELRREGSRS
jgi:hypothetical protein